MTERGGPYSAELPKLLLPQLEVSIRPQGPTNYKPLLDLVLAILVSNTQSSPQLRWTRLAGLSGVVGGASFIVYAVPNFLEYDQAYSGLGAFHRTGLANLYGY